MHYRMREEKIQNIAPSSCNHFERRSSTTLCFCFRLFAFELRAVKDIEMAKDLTGSNCSFIEEEEDYGDD